MSRPLFSKDDIRRAQQSFTDKMARADPSSLEPTPAQVKSVSLGARLQAHADKGQIDVYRSMNTGRKCGANRRP